MSSPPNTARLEDNLREAVRSLVSASSLASQATVDMSTLIRVTSTLPLSTMGQWERSISSEFSLASYHQKHATPSWSQVLRSLARPKAVAGTSRFPTWVDLANCDGHARERSLRTLAGPAPNRFFLCLAVRRLNDWVPQVRAAAREVVPAIAQSSATEDVVDMLCAVLPIWIYWQRAKELDKATMTSLLSIEGIAAALTRRLIDSPTGPMSAVLSQALRTPAFDEHLAQIAEHATQPTVRASAYRALLSGKTAWVEERHWQWKGVRHGKGSLINVLGERALAKVPDFPETLHAAAADRSSVVRRIAASALIRELASLGDTALSLAQRFAEDASPPVAERGRFALERLAEKSE